MSIENLKKKMNSLLKMKSRGKSTLFAIFASVIAVLAANNLYERWDQIWEPTKLDFSNIRRFQRINGDDLSTYGSGFNIKFKGKYYVITNRHVCNVSIRLGYPGKALVNGKMLNIIKKDYNHDLCALEADEKKGFELAKREAKPLEKVWLIGHPRGMDMVVREGRIINNDKEICVGGYITGAACYYSNRISALAYPGNSGSPVLNSEGRVVNVLFAGHSMYPNEPYTVPYYDLKNFLESL